MSEPESAKAPECRGLGESELEPVKAPECRGLGESELEPVKAPEYWRWLGLIAYACYAAHAAWFISEGRPTCLLWGCHLAALGVGTGLMFRVPTFNAMGVLSLAWGVPLWILDFTTGGEFIVTSMLTHVGGSVLGVFGIIKLGLPKRTWIVLWLTTAALLTTSYLIGPEKENVNLSYGPPAGWEDKLPPYPVFGLIVMAGAACVFGGAQLILRKLFKRYLLDGPPASTPPE